MTKMTPCRCETTSQHLLETKSRHEPETLSRAHGPDALRGVDETKSQNNTPGGEVGR